MKMENMTRLVKLQDIADIRAGYPFRGRIEPVAVGTHRVIQIKDIGTNHRVKEEGLFLIDMPSSADSYLVKPGDVLFQSRGSRNFGTPISEPLPRTIASGHLFVIRPHQNILPEYLAWFINQPPAQLHIKAHQRGSYVPLIPKDALNELEVAVPPIAVQQSIVELERLRIKEEELQRAICEKRTQIIQAVCANLARSR